MADPTCEGGAAWVESLRKQIVQRGASRAFWVLTHDFMKLLYDFLSTFSRWDSLSQMSFAFWCAAAILVWTAVEVDVEV